MGIWKKENWKRKINNENKVHHRVTQSFTEFHRVKGLLLLAFDEEFHHWKHPARSKQSPSIKQGNTPHEANKKKKDSVKLCVTLW